MRCADPDGPLPRPGSSTCSRPTTGGAEATAERPFLPRAFSVLRADADPAGRLELQFLIEDVGPGTRRLCELGRGRRAAARRPARQRLRAAARGPPRAARRRRRRDRAARDLAGPARRGRPPALLGFRDGAHAARRGAPDAAPGSRPTTAASATTDSSPSCCSTSSSDASERDRGVRLRPARRCSRRCGRSAPSTGVPAQLALESGMACGFGACFGCVVPTRDGYVRLCLDGPGARRRAARDRGWWRHERRASAASSSSTRSSTGRGRSTRSRPGARSATS